VKADWRKVPLGELVELKYGKALKAEERPENGHFPVYGSNGIVGTSDNALVDHPTIVIGRKGAVGEAHLAEHGCWPIDTTFYTSPRPGTNFSLHYLLLCIRSIDLKQVAITSTIPGLNRDTLASQIILVPPCRSRSASFKSYTRQRSCGGSAPRPTAAPLTSSPPCSTTCSVITLPAHKVGRSARWPTSRRREKVQSGLDPSEATYIIPSLSRRAFRFSELKMWYPMSFDGPERDVSPQRNTKALHGFGFIRGMFWSQSWAR